MLTAAQKTALKTNIQANNNTVINTANGQPIAISAIIPNTATDFGDNMQHVADWYNGLASPDFFVFRSDVQSQEIFDQVTWANYTPQDAIPVAAVPASPTEQEKFSLGQWQARSLCCQGKQFNLQIMLQGQSNTNAGHIQLRAGLNDATTSLPSGVAGASKSGGWVGILAILKRKAKNLEKLFAVATTGVGTSGSALGDTLNPGLMVFEGTINGNDVFDALLNG